MRHTKFYNIIHTYNSFISLIISRSNNVQFKIYHLRKTSLNFPKQKSRNFSHFFRFLKKTYMFAFQPLNFESPTKVNSTVLVTSPRLASSRFASLRLTSLRSSLLDRSEASVYKSRARVFA